MIDSEGVTASEAPGRRALGRIPIPLWIFLVALVHRILVVLWTSTIASDSAYYLWTAEYFAEGETKKALENFGAFHPLYPYLVSLLGRAIGSFETAGYVLSTLFGSLVTFFVYLYVRTLWNERWARWAALLYALHPELALETTDIKLTAPLLFFFSAGVSTLLVAVRTGRIVWFAPAALSAALAFLTKPEGASVIGLYLLIPGIEIVLRWKRRERGKLRLAAGMAGGLLIVLLAASPYLLWMRQKTGSWSFTQRGSIVQIWERITRPRAAGEDAPSDRKPLSVAFQKIQQAFYGPLLPFFVLGFLLHRRSGVPWRSVWAPLLMSALCLLLPLSVFLLDRQFRPSQRYLFPAVLLLLPWASGAFLILRDAAVAAWPRRGIPIVMVVSLLLLLLPRSLRPRRADERSFLEAAAWLHSRPPEWERILVTSNEKVSYYAGWEMREVPLSSSPKIWRYLPAPRTVDPSSTWDEDLSNPADLHVPQTVRDLFDRYRMLHASFLVLDGKSLRHLPRDIDDLLPRLGFETVASFPTTPRTDQIPVRIYRWKPVGS